MNKTKIERLQAIKEEFAQAQARLAEVKRLEEQARAESLATLLENDLEQAELVLAAKDIMSKLQDMAEDLAKINAQDLFPLVDRMKFAFGPQRSKEFEATAQSAITQAMNNVRHAKDEMGNAILKIEGGLLTNDMADDLDDTPSDVESDLGDEEVGDDLEAALDDFGGDDSAAGPEDEPLGRAKKESVEPVKAPLNESLILETAGKKLLETEGLENLISWVLTEASSVMPDDQFRSFAANVATKAAYDPEKLAGWIGKKKHGMAAMIQLAEPTCTANTSIGIVESVKANEDCYGPFSNKNDAISNARKEVGGGEEGVNFSIKEKEDGWYWSEAVDEGKTFKRDADDDADEKKKKYSDRKAARREKMRGDDAVSEGKTFKRDLDDEDEDDNNWSKKSKFQSRKKARREKMQGDDTLGEAHQIAEAMAKMIEANIALTGKGKAAEVVKAFGEKTLSEDSSMTVLEAFEDLYGMKPAEYSISALKEFTSGLSTTDKKNAAGVMGKLATKMAGDRSAADKPISSALAGLSGQERNVANKMINTMKKKGQDPKKIGDLAAGGADLIDENINAANWPVDTMGQYKGEPMSTDFGKHCKDTAPPKETKGSSKKQGPLSTEEPATEEASDTTES